MNLTQREKDIAVEAFVRATHAPVNPLCAGLDAVERSRLVTPVIPPVLPWYKRIVPKHLR